MNLILFTASYPYVRGNEASFLNIEVEYLIKKFNRVVVVPETIKDAIPVEHFAVEVDTSYAKLFSVKNVTDLTRLSFSSSMLFKGIMESSFPRFSPTAWRRLIAFTGKAELTRRWSKDLLERRGFESKDCLFYAYWLDHAVAGIGMLRNQYPEVGLVSRAHGYDIYEELYYDPPFWPCRQNVLQQMDKVYADSYAGTEYLKVRYPDFLNKFTTSLLGVRDPGFLTSRSQDNVFRIVSCSRISPEKRVGLLLEGIVAAAKLRPTQEFEWHHFGNGDQREEFQRRVDSMFPVNAKGYFPGFSDGNILMDFYKKNPIDVFVNSSITEGTSVAIMEAMSCGVPTLATRVGGNVEIVSDENGWLIPADSSAEDVAAALTMCVDDPQPIIKRIGSKQKWAREYNADVNFPEFAQGLKSLRKIKAEV